jgi:hypothetical protein
MPMGDASLDLEGVSINGEDRQPQALACGSVVSGGVGAMDMLADMAVAVVCTTARVIVAAGAPTVVAQAAAPVTGLTCGNLTVAVLKSWLQMYCGVKFVLDDKIRYKTTMATPGDQGGFDPARMLIDEDLVVRKAAQGSRVGTRRGAAGTLHSAAATVPTTHLQEHVEPLSQKTGVSVGEQLTPPKPQFSGCHFWKVPAHGCPARGWRQLLLYLPAVTSACEGQPDEFVTC